VKELSHVLAFDIGGSHATAGIVHGESLEVGCMDSCAINSNGAADSILKEICELGEGVLAKARQSGASSVGLAFACRGPSIMSRALASCVTSFFPYIE
jgi:hypothetical protein